MLLWLSASVWGQSSTSATLSAANVAVGPQNVWATYQDAEFIIDRVDMEVRVTTIDAAGQGYDLAPMPATVAEVSAGVFRADVDAYTWIEVNASEGTTTVCMRGIDRIYHPVWH